MNHICRNIKHPFAAGILIINDHGEILSVSREKDYTNWGLPFGGSRSGETPKQTAVRELFEETGLHVSIEDLRLLFIKECDGIQALTFITSKYSGSIRNSEEGVVCWKTFDCICDETCLYKEYNQDLLKSILTNLKAN